MDRELSCEERRRQNIADNKRILAEIGLINPFKNAPKLVLKKSGLKRKADYELPRQRKRPLLEENVDHSNRGSVMGTRRRSARLQDNAPGEGSEFLQLEDDFDEEQVENRRVEKNRPNHYGSIPGVDVGASWYTRMECCRDGIHRPTVAGIHAGADGAYSIALSGGYDDNVDYGECFTYTGEGGRDLKGTRTNPKNLRTAPQSKNQTLTRGNLALSKNVETGYPVRVIRGYKLNTAFAPEEGYRYDGLYTVEKAWYTFGTSGFMVWKFALKRCKDQAPPPWEFTEEMKSANADKSFEENGNRSNEDQEEGIIDKDLNLDKDLDKTKSKEDEEEGENSNNSDGSPSGKPKKKDKRDEDKANVCSEEKRKENTDFQEKEKASDQGKEDSEADLEAGSEDKKCDANESSPNKNAESVICSENSQKQEEEKNAAQDMESEDSENKKIENEISDIEDSVDKENSDESKETEIMEENSDISGKEDKGE